jgi:uracil DNA glycosylase
VAANKAPSMKEGFMNPNSIEFIYKAINAIASGKHNPETEQCLSDAIDEELLLINANLALERPHELIVLPPQVEAHIAAG